MTRRIIIAQARMSSTRLPGKTLMDLAGKPVIDHVLERAQACGLADGVWVATSTDAADDVLAAHLDDLGLPYVRGSLDDVLARYAQAAESARADTIIRITCDCPLIDPEVIDSTIAGFRKQPEVDYCSNVLKRTYPIGLDTEVFSRGALERAHTEARHSHEREHVTPYLYQQPGLFRLRNVEAPGWATWPELRLTLDEVADFELLSSVMALVPAGARLRALLDAVRADPALVGVNSHVGHRHVRGPEAW